MKNKMTYDEALEALEEKECSMCNESFTVEFFHRQKGAKFGCSCRCKKCYARYQKARHSLPTVKAHRKAVLTTYKEENRESHLEYQREYQREYRALNKKEA